MDQPACLYAVMAFDDFGCLIRVTLYTADGHEPLYRAIAPQQGGTHDDRNWCGACLLEEVDEVIQRLELPHIKSEQLRLS